MTKTITNQFPLGLHFPTAEPFLFCAHHYDNYPKGTDKFGPEAKHLQGRAMGSDFEGKDGFRMYHGKEVPGFPVHPHRGFETITIVRKGYVDHADSLGAAGRYGEGDVQWMTAGLGVQHSEMFPLLKKDQENTTELFQIWLNLPKAKKTAPAHFTMFWSEKIPCVKNAGASVSIIAGEYNRTKALTPPPNSWAFEPEHEVTILLAKLDPGARIKIPATKSDLGRMLYFFEGQKLSVNGETLIAKTGAEVQSEMDIEITNSGSQLAEILFMQAKPIGEPVFQHGPFVMNSREDILRTINEYQQNEFGGWPWPRNDMVHGGEIRRFAKFPDGKIETPAT